MEVVEDLSCRKMPVFCLVFSYSNPSNKEQDLVLLRFKMLFTNVTSVKSSQNNWDFALEKYIFYPTLGTFAIFKGILKRYNVYNTSALHLN